MTRKILLLLTAMLVWSNLMTLLAQGEVPATTTSVLNVRGEPSRTSARIGRLPDNTAIIVEGRNEAGDWLLVRSQDGSLRGWVAIGFVQFTDAIRILDLPLKPMCSPLPPRLTRLSPRRTAQPPPTSRRNH
jgi:uncharacterized protein YraI